MAHPEASMSTPQTVPKLGIVAVLLAAVVVGSLIFRAATGTSEDQNPIAEPAAQATASPSPAPLPTERTAEPSPTEPAAETEPQELTSHNADLVPAVPQLARDLGLAPAPLGSFVVARPSTGIFLTAPDGPIGHYETPVFDEPAGDPRELLDRNLIDGVDSSIALTNWPDSEGVRVFRLIAGGPNDDYLMVQAPTRPHDQFTWVRRSDFDFGHTDMRIEIDLAEGGGLVLMDGQELVVRSAIVYGRSGRETPTHLTYIEFGIDNEDAVLSPAYGSAILRIASFSEKLGAFGGGLPSNYLHGTNAPELMGQQVSSGEVRVPNDVIDEIVETIKPGTPVLVYDSSVALGHRSAILDREPTLAPTEAFTHEPGEVSDQVTSITPQLWRRCGTEPGVLCRRPGS